VLEGGDKNGSQGAKVANAFFGSGAPPGPHLSEISNQLTSDLVDRGEDDIWTSQLSHLKISQFCVRLGKINWKFLTSSQSFPVMNLILSQKLKRTTVASIRVTDLGNF
jgi:hypothetical protein